MKPMTKAPLPLQLRADDWLHMRYHKSALLKIFLPLLLAALILATSAAAPAAAESTCSEATSSAEFWGVGVFYYVWYGSPGTDGAYMHWNHSVLPHWNAQVQAKHAGITLFENVSVAVTRSPGSDVAYIPPYDIHSVVSVVN
jgi:hypothetical protein